MQFQKLKQKFKSRMDQLKSVEFYSFQHSLVQFWEFFNNEPVFAQMKENLLNDFPNVSEKVQILLNSMTADKPSGCSKESIAVVFELIDNMSKRNDLRDFRSALHSIAYPIIFDPPNCKTQGEIDNNYLKIFKSRYLDKFSFYVEEQLEEKLEQYEMINKSEDDLENKKSTVIQNFHAPVGSNLIGNNNISNVNQNIGQNFSDILEHLANLKREFQVLPSEEREEAIEIVDALEIEVQSENPSKGKVKAYLSSVKDFAVKTGTDVTSKILVELIKSQIGIG